MTSSAPTVRDNAAAHQFEIDAGAEPAIAAYRIDGDVITFTHTFVPEAARGNGVATRLIEAGLAAARSRGLKVTPQCEAFAEYMERHVETQDLLVPASR